MKFQTGFLPDAKDVRDWLYKEQFQLGADLAAPVRKWWPPSHWVGGGEQLRDVDLRSMMPDIYDQGAFGSCVENAWCAALAFDENKEGNGVELLSRKFMWWQVRDTDGTLTNGPNQGSSIRSGIKAVADAGIPLETLWPYESDYTVKPDVAAWVDAASRKSVSYARLLTLADMQSCLMNGYPFVFGMALYAPYEGLTGTLPMLPMPKNSDQGEGWHAQCAVGMSVKDEAFLVRNSWGTGWGDGGHYLLPWSYVSAPTLATDFWTCRKIPK